MNEVKRPAKRPKADLYKLQNPHREVEEMPLDLEDEKPRREEKGRKNRKGK